MKLGSCEVAFLELPHQAVITGFYRYFRLRVKGAWFKLPSEACTYTYIYSYLYYMIKYVS